MHLSLGITTVESIRKEPIRMHRWRARVCLLKEKTISMAIKYEKEWPSHLKEKAL